VGVPRVFGVFRGQKNDSFVKRLGFSKKTVFFEEIWAGGEDFFGVFKKGGLQTT
jgi:hypothetical protein